MDGYIVIIVLFVVILLMTIALLWLADTVFSIPAGWQNCRKKTSTSAS